MFSLFCDVEAYDAAQMRSIERNSGPDAKVAKMESAESYENTLSQRFKDLKVSGLAPMVDKVVAHPLTGQKMHVCVYGISPESAQAALRTRWDNLVAAQAIRKAQKTVQGQPPTTPSVGQHKKPPKKKKPPQPDQPKTKEGPVSGDKPDKDF